MRGHKGSEASIAIKGHSVKCDIVSLLASYRDFDTGYWYLAVITVGAFAAFASASKLKDLMVTLLP